jgi:2-C-methyl-D-erythritol 4-phosphate cytidylyltransferase
MADSSERVGVLIPAAGKGERVGAGEPKQFRELAGAPLLLRALRPFTSHPAVRHVVIALPPERAGDPPPWLADLVGTRVVLVPGGAVRAASVRAALAVLDPACDIVLVHDAARPLVSRATIDAVIGVAENGNGAVPGVPVGDTLKRADGSDRRITETVARDGLWRAQTPQAFPRRLLEDAFATAGEDVARFTDEAALVEAAGGVVEVVPDASTNIKVTTAADFRIAAALLDT